MPRLVETPLIPLDSQTMRDHAVGRQRDWALAAKELDKVFNASPPATPAPSRRYITAEEACAGLGLDPQVKSAAEQGIRAMVSENASGFEVAKTLRAHGVRQPIVKELLARGMRMTAEFRASRSVADLYVRKSGAPQGAGWMPIPKGKSGGFRRPKSGGGYEYAYPDGDGGYTSHDNPAADEHAHVHEEHENGTPDPKVRARMEQMEAKAKAAGLAFTGTATARTTMKHLNELEKQVDKAIAQKRQREKAGGGKGDNPEGKKKLADDDVHATPAPGGKGPEKGSNSAEAKNAGGKNSAGDDPPKPPPDAEEEPGNYPGGRGFGSKDHGQVEQVDSRGEVDPEPSQKQHRENRIRDLGEAKGIDKAEIDRVLADPDFQTEDGQHKLIEHLETFPDLVDNLPDEVPTDKGERSALEAHAAKLEETIAKMEAAHTADRETHAKEMAELRAAIKRYSEHPSPKRAAETTSKVWGFALITFGFVAGFMFAGPMGALLGGSMANQLIKTGVAKSVPYEPLRLSPGLWFVGNDIVLVKAFAHPEGSGWMSVPGGKRGGYRRPKSGGGYEYWYRDEHDAKQHAAYHDARGAESRGAAANVREMAERPDVKRDSLRQTADRLDVNAAGHEDHARIARETAPGKRAVDGDNPHKGKKTLGPDEGKVWSTIADLFNGVEANAEGEVVLTYGQTIAPEMVTVRGVEGEMHNIKVSVQVGEGYGGKLESRSMPSVGKDGRLDYERMKSKPVSIIINTPAGRLNRDALVERARRTLSHELAHAMDSLTGSHAKRDREAYGEHGDSYYNDPAEIVAYRHNIFRELNTPEVAKDTKTLRDAFRSSAEETKETRAFLREQGDDVGPLAVSEKPNLGADRVIVFLEKHSPTWAQVSPYLNPANRRKMLSAAAAVLQAHHDDASEPAAKSLPPPPPLPGAIVAPPRIRARHGANEHGHTDGLLPGQRLTVRKGVKGPQAVEVLPGGAFQWGDNRYDNGRQLIKALTGNPDHKLTVRRYFGLGTEAARLAKAMADGLRVKYPDLLVSAYQGRVRVEGALAQAGIPVDNPLDTTALLDLHAVQAILSPESP